MHGQFEPTNGIDEPKLLHHIVCLPLMPYCTVSRAIAAIVYDVNYAHEQRTHKM